MQRFDADSLVDAVLLTARSGDLTVGARLPTIATLARSLGLSNSTVSLAWKSLVQMGVIETNRRGGTHVARPVAATSYRARGQTDARFRYRLAAGYPDPALQPDLRRILHQVADRAEFPGYPGKDDISPGLREALLRRLGYEPEALLLDTEVIGALPRVLQAVSHRGASIGVSNPEFPLYPAIIRQLGMNPAAVTFTGRYDEVDLERVLRSGARAVLVQTRVHNPTGRRVPTENLAAIAELLRRFDATAIEIDHHGALEPESDVRLASLAPERVVALLSFAKEIHPDVRVAAIAGPQAVLERVSAWRAGGEWVSSINRAILETCLSDPEVAAIVAHARDEYGRRRMLFRDRFASAGLTIASDAGINLWIPVRDEKEALLHLAVDGIAAARGSAFAIGRAMTTPHLHASLGTMGADSDFLSERFLRAALATPSSVY